MNIIQITPTSDTASLRFKSWLPEYASGGRPVVLAGRELPSRVGDVASTPARALCLAPGEWLIVIHDTEAAALRERIAGDLARYGLQLIDASHELAAIELRGSAAREVLAKGCGLDLDHRSFAAGQCARTRLAQIAVAIDCVDDTPRFQLYVARSYFQYLYSWLIDAAAEFGAVPT
jgi:sarcosine oxidase, subunit gamma